MGIIAITTGSGTAAPNVALRVCSRVVWLVRSSSIEECSIDTAESLRVRDLDREDTEWYCEPKSEASGVVGMSSGGFDESCMKSSSWWRTA